MVTIISDYGLKDGSAAVVKAKLLQNNTNIPVVDISHQVNPFDLPEAAFIVNNVYKKFPNNTIHLICVGALYHPEEKPICVQLDNHYFIANNNGIVSLLAPNLQPDGVYELNFHTNKNMENDVINIFCEVALHLLQGGNISVVGKEIQEYKTFHTMQPTVKGNQITGFIVYVDNYGNAISNISKKLFNEIGKQRNFEILARNYSFSSLRHNYSDVVQDFNKETQYHGQSMALFNSNNWLEIAMYKSNHNSVGGASSLLGLYKGEKVIINFK